MSSDDELSSPPLRKQAVVKLMKCESPSSSNQHQLILISFYIVRLLVIILFRCYFNGNQNIPIHNNSSCAILAEEIVTTLFEAKEDIIATEQPLQCTETASFIVDSDKLSHPSDIRMDDMGSWVNSGVDRLYVSVTFSGENKVLRVNKLRCRPAVMRNLVYCLTRSYWKHKQSGSLFSRQLHQLSG